MTQPATDTTQGHALHPSIIREYDIRGLVDQTLFSQDAYVIGRMFATMVAESIDRQPTIALGRDGRLSSPSLSKSLAEGLRDAGAEVVQIGVGPTPMLYFSVYHLNADAGVMLTGSHNPANYNGFKLMLGRSSFYGEQIRTLAERAEQGNWQSGEGSIRNENVKIAYLDALLDASRINADQPMQVIWDPGNGAAGEICNMLAKQLTKQNCVSVLLNAEIDGNFPNHHPDPSLPENMRELQQLVVNQEAQLGVAFDGDGDRLGAVDDKGRILSPDHLLMLLAQHVLDDTPGGRVIADVKTSQLVLDAVAQAGGEPLMWKTGHSHIKTKMKEIDAAFAGEASGHIFFADRYYGFDDGLYAALRLIELVSTLDKPLSDVIDALPQTSSTPEIRIDVPEERKFVVIDEIRARLDAAGENYLDIDGVRMTTPQGWWLIRASNTQAAIIARAEAADAAALTELKRILSQQLEASGVSMDAF